MKMIPSRALLLLSAASLLAGCGTEPAPPFVSLSPPRGAQGGPPRADEPALRIGVASIESPEVARTRLKPLVRHIGSRLGMPAEIVSRTTYSEINSLLGSGDLDAAFTCSGPYVEARREFGAEIIAVPRIKGGISYRSYVVVRRDSGIEDFAGLEGRVFAHTDPLSTTGKIYPDYFLRTALGKPPGGFFARTIFSRSHDNSIRAVEQRLADGAAVSSLVWHRMESTSPSILSELKVIHKSPAFSMPPVMVRANLPGRLKSRLKTVLLSLHAESEGREILRALGKERYIPQDDAAYDDIRRMKRLLDEAPRSP